MKKLIILLAIFTTFATTAQSVGINADGSAANASAMLDVSSTTKGVFTSTDDLCAKRSHHFSSNRFNDFL
ncbi:hypothetical protein MCEGE10_01505 [Flavobacteriaceae bacterium]